MQWSLLSADRFFCWSPAPPAGQCQTRIMKALLMVWDHVKSVPLSKLSIVCLAFTVSSDMECFTFPKLTRRSGSLDLFSLLWWESMPLIKHSTLPSSWVGYWPQPAARSLAGVCLSCVQVSTCLKITLSLELMSGTRLFSLLHLF